MISALAALIVTFFVGGIILAGFIFLFKLLLWPILIPTATIGPVWVFLLMLFILALF